MSRRKAQQRRRKRIILASLGFSVASLAVVSGVLQVNGDRLIHDPDTAALRDGKSSPGLADPTLIDKQASAINAAALDGQDASAGFAVGPELYFGNADERQAFLTFSLAQQDAVLTESPELFLDESTSPKKTSEKTPKKKPSRRRAQTPDNTAGGLSVFAAANAFNNTAFATGVVAGRGGFIGASARRQSAGTALDGTRTLTTVNQDLAVTTRPGDDANNRRGNSGPPTADYDPCVLGGLVVSPCYVKEIAFPQSSRAALTGLSSRALGNTGPDNQRRIGLVTPGTPPGPVATNIGPTSGDSRQDTAEPEDNAASDTAVRTGLVVSSASTTVPVPGPLYLLGFGLLFVLSERVYRR